MIVFFLNFVFWGWPFLFVSTCLVAKKLTGTDEVLWYLILDLLRILVG